MTPGWKRDRLSKIPMTHKLSASALSLFLKSPKAYFWRYKAKLEPVQMSVATYDHDKLCGTIWAQFVDRFYKGVSERENGSQAMQDWLEQTDGWVPEKARERLTKALEAWGAQYYQMFRADDGCRNGSELHLENDRFIAYLDGLSHDRVVHEVKSTSRSPNMSEQMLKVQTSIQVKLYSVMSEATGICIEFAFKDSPYQVVRGPVVPVTLEQRLGWEHELNTLADAIYAMGDDEHNYPCHTDGCTIITKNFVGSCPYQMLCLDGITEVTQMGYKAKAHRK